MTWRGANRRSSTGVLLAAGAIVGGWLLFFAPLLTGGGRLAYRDAGSFYGPQFAWQQREWGAGRVPLWNPQEGLGSPVVEDATTSVFYPGKLIFALPIDFDAAFNLYVTLHLLLAAAGAYRFARQAGASPSAATLGATSYAFGGAVVSQTCNVVFLIGAAWLPLAASQIRSIVGEQTAGRRWGASCRLGAVQALMVLGGDPQMAYHVALAGLLFAARSHQTAHGAWRARAAAAGWLAAATLLAMVLAAVQIVPSVLWARQSDRVDRETPRSLQELALDAARHTLGASPPSSFTNGLVAQPTPGTHLHDVYQFSFPPWRLLELLAPNVFGRSFPIHERWALVIPAEPREWAASVYLGLLPIGLALLGWRVRGADRTCRTLAWLTIGSTLASFGIFGFGWLVHEVGAGMGLANAEQPPLGWPVGGVYWCLVLALPGYVFFRYPAKLFVIAAFGLSQTAALATDHHSARQVRSFHAVLFAVSLAALVLVLLARQPVLDWFRQTPPDAVFGPLAVERAYRGLLWSLGQTAVVSAAAIVLFTAVSGAVTRQWLLVGVTLVDLWLANGWLSPAAHFDRLPVRWQLGSGNVSDGFNRGLPPARVLRPSVHQWFPPSWSAPATRERLQQVIDWERDTLAPKYHLESPDFAAIRSPSSLQQHDLAAVLAVLSAPSTTPAVRDAIADTLGIAWQLGPPAAVSSRDRDPRATAPCENATVVPAASARPRVWLVRNWRSLSPLTTNRRRDLIERTRQVFAVGGTVPADGSPLDAARIAVVESHQPPPLPDAPPPARADQCELTQYASQRIVVEIDAAAPALLVVGELYSADWQAWRYDDSRRAPQRLTIHRANRLLRAVAIPPGRQTIVLAYRPRWLKPAALVSLVGWCVCLFYCRIVQDAL